MVSNLTRRNVDSLLEFAPLFAKSKGIFGQWQDRSYHREDRTFIAAYWFEYGDQVQAFNRLLQEDGWLDSDYNPVTVNPFVQDLSLIAGADLRMIRWMLTYFVRGERFCEGVQQSLIRKGFVSAVLGRLEELRPGFPED